MRVRFGDEGLALMPDIRQIADLERLEAIVDRLWTATELPLNGQ